MVFQRKNARTIFIISIAFCILFLLYAACFLTGALYSNYTAKIIHIKREDNIGTVVDESILVKISSGKLSGREYWIDSPYDSAFATEIYRAGDAVFIGYNSANGTKEMYISEYDRRWDTFFLLLLLYILVILVAGKQGILSLCGMLVSVTIVMIFVIPNILAGRDPLLLALLSSLIIIPVTYYLAHGLYKKTTVAVIATFITLIVMFALACLFTYLLRVPSIISTDNTTGYYTSSGSLISVQSFYLAGLVIGSLAVLNDITISQASVVFSLYSANKNLSRRDLFLHAMHVGRDHVASLINTLLLVYIGTSFPFFLTFVKESSYTGFDISNPLLSVILLQISVVSIGIILAVPITTYLATRIIVPHIDVA